MTERCYIRSFSYLVIVFTCFLHSLVAGQSIPREILFERIAIPGTIRSSQVTNIIRDKLGIIWLAGHGLYRYDGFQFHQYSALSSGEMFDPEDILSLFYDSAGNRVLLGTRRFGIVAYNYQSNDLTQLPTADPPIVNELAQTSDGRMWAISYTGGLFYLEKDSLRKVADPEKLFLHPSSLATKGSRLYVGEKGKIVVMEQSHVIEEIKLSWQGEDIPAYTLATTLFLDRNNKLWIGTEKQGVLVYDLIEKKHIKYFPPTQSPFFNKISQILQDRDGLVWILTKASGLVVYSPEEDRILHLMKNPFSAKSISSDNCFSIMEDREGIIWVGATGDINKYDRQQIKFKHISHNPLSKLSLTDNMVRGVCEDHEGKIWIGTDGGYINLFDPKNESLEHIKVKLKNDPANYTPLYFLELNDRMMLIGTPLGLLQYDRRTRVISPYLPLWEITQKRIVRQMLRHQNVLYFISSGGFFVHNMTSGTTERYKNAGNEDAVNVTTIHLDDQYRLWLGSNKGVSRFDPVQKKFYFTTFRNSPVAADGSLLLVLSIQQAGNKLYVGTFNAGLWEIDISDVQTIPSPKNFLDRDGLPSNTVYASLPDNNGNLWLSTNNGLAKFETDSRQFISFSISEGLQEEEFNRLAYTTTKSGHLVFGGINGINIFKPSEITIDKQRFTPTILSVTADNPLSKAPQVSRFAGSEKNLTFNYRQNFINIHFFVPHYKQPRRYSIFYRLENFEKNWKEVSGENVATYSNLQPGSYNFQLKTVGLNGEEEVVQMVLTVSPPYWKTWWFVLLSVCVVAFLVMTIIRSYIRKAQHDRQRLEALLKVRTYEIEKSKEDLQVLNQKKDLIFSILSHDLRSPLTTLKGFLGYIIDHAEELTTEDLKKHAVNIKNSVSNSLDLIDNTLFWSLSQMGNIHYTPTSFSLPHLLEKLKGLYQLTADKKRIPLSVLCNEEIIVHGDENMIYVTLRNLVSNALKFTSEGNPVVITCNANNNFVEINVIDKGIGMSQDYLKRILAMDQPMLKKGTSNEKGTGLGLLLCQKFIELNKGELRITSAENVGTTFTVTLPLTIHATANAAMPGL